MSPEEQEVPPQQNIQINRREFLRLVALGGAAAYATARWGELVKFAQATFKSPEKLEPNPFEVGFTTHAMDVKENGKPGLETFKKHIDLLKATNQQWVRLDLRPWHLVKGGTPDKIDWNEENLQIYEQAINYARGNGLKLFMHVFGPDFASDYSPDVYKKVIGSYFGFLADRFTPKNTPVNDVWQIYNEPDFQTFRKYQEFYNLDPKYLAEFADIVKVADTAIKSKNPHAKTTVNLTHFFGAPWGGPEAFMKRAAKFCDAVAAPLDYISFDTYPYRDESEIKALPAYVSFLKNRYKKEVFIAELGAPGGIADYSEDEQAKLISRYLSALRGGKDLPKAVILYELSDEANVSNLPDKMGVLHYNGVPKSSFVAVMQAMQPLLRPTTTPTPTPTT